MQDREKYIGCEIVFTFSMLLICIVLVWQSIASLAPYLVIATAAGFFFSWLMRKQPIPFAYVGINAGAVAICLWTFYLLSQSSFFYRDVVLISVKGVLLMEALFAFGADLPMVLSSAQLLSVPVFISSPLFSGSSQIVHLLFSIAYVICWMGICRVKLYLVAAGTGRPAGSNRHSISALVLLFAVVLFTSFAVFSAVSWKRLDKGGVFWAEQFENKVNLEEELEKQYYNLQEKIGLKISKVATGLSTAQKGRELVYLYSPLTNDSLEIVEVNNAQEGLLSYLRSPGAGIEENDIKNLVAMLEEYIDKRILLNAMRAKNRIATLFKANPFSIAEKYRGMDLANKMQYSNSPREIRDSERQASALLNRSSPAVKEEVKNKLKDLFNRLREWKIFSVYRQKITDVLKEAGSLNEQDKKEVAGLVYETVKAAYPQTVKLVKEKIKDLKKSSDGEKGQVLEDLAAAVSLKQEMFVSYEGRVLEEKIQNHILPEAEEQRLSGLIREVCNVDVPAELNANARELKNSLISEGTKDTLIQFRNLALAKAEMLIDMKLTRLGKAVRESARPEQAAALLKSIEELAGVKNTEKLLADVAQLKNDILDFKRQGKIDAALSDKLEQGTQEINDLVLFMLENLTVASPVQSGPEKTSYKQELKNRLDSLALDKKTEDVLKGLIADLENARTAAQVENIKDKFVNTLKSAAKALNLPKEEVKKTADSFNTAAQVKKDIILEQAFREVRKGIDTLSMLDSQQAAALDAKLEVLKQTTADDAFEKELEKMKAEVSRMVAEAQAQAAKESPAEQKEEAKPEEKAFDAGGWKIYVYPVESEVNIGSLIDMKAIAVYNNALTKEVTSEVEWHSSMPAVAEIDARGTARALNEGKTRVSCNYKGIKSQDAQITVLPQGAAAVKTEEHLAIFPKQMEVNVNTPLEFKAFFHSADNRVKEVSSESEFIPNDTAAFTADNYGDLIPTIPGSYTVIARYNNFLSDPCSVIVTAPLESESRATRLLNLDILPFKPEAQIDEPIDFLLLGTFIDPVENLYSVKNIDRRYEVLIENEGKVSAAKGKYVKFASPGEYNVFFRYDQMESYRQKCDVVPLRVIEHGLKHVTLLPESIMLPVGARVQFRVFGSFRDNHAEDLTAKSSWSVDKEGVVSRQGPDEFRAEAVGIVHLYAETGGVKSLAAKITVFPAGASMPQVQPLRRDSNSAEVEPVKKEVLEDIEENANKLNGAFSGRTRKTGKIIIVPESLQLAVGEEDRLQALFVYNDGSQEDITLLGDWSSEDGTVARVGDGKVEAVSIGKTDVRVQFKGNLSTPCHVTVTPPRLVSIAVSPEHAEIAINGKLKLHAEGYYSDSAHKDITDLADWQNSNPRVAKMEGRGRLRGAWVGTTEIRAEYLGVTSLPANIKVKFTIGWLIGQGLKFLMMLLLMLAAVLWALFVISEKEKKKLKKLFDTSKRQFIIGIYYNLCKILELAGLSNKDHLPPLSFASVVETAHNVKENEMLILTAGYEEAKYSNHAMDKEHAMIVLKHYNSLLPALYSQKGRMPFLRIFVLSLMRRMPFGEIKI